MRLFSDLKNQTERDKAIIFWQELLGPTAKSFGWTWPWLTRQRDDRVNVFSAWRSEIARGFTLDEVEPDLTTFDAFGDQFDPEGTRVTYLRVRTDGSVANISTICRVFDLWVATAITPEEINSILASHTMGDRKPLITR